MKLGDVEYPSLRDKVSAPEWQTRVELAALYHIVPMFGWDDESLTHVSARIPGTDHYLFNPLGFLFEEITASSLIKIDVDGRVQQDTPFEITIDGWYPMKAVHTGRGDANYVMHVHNVFGLAVAAQEGGLLPISQPACFVLADGLAYHDFDGIETYESKIPGLQLSLGKANRLILRNHGLLTLGPTAEVAFRRMYGLARACEVQIMAQAGGGRLTSIPKEVLDTFPYEISRRQGNRSWPGLLRKLHRTSPEFAM